MAQIRQHTNARLTVRQRREMVSVILEDVLDAVGAAPRPAGAQSGIASASIARCPSRLSGLRPPTEITSTSADSSSSRAI